MAEEALQFYDWREKTTHLAWKLDRAHSTVKGLGAAIDAGSDRTAQRMAKTAHEVVDSAANAVESLQHEKPLAERLSETDVIGSTLAIESSGVAIVALDVMINAMLALAATDDEDDSDFLIGACIDAESAFEVGAAVAQAVPTSDGAAIRDLRRAFATEGGSALRRRVADAFPRVREVHDRTGGRGRTVSQSERVGAPVLTPTKGR